MGQRKRPKGSGATPSGVWNRHAGSGPANPIRVRTKRLDEIDSDKIALAYWLLAKQIVADESDARQLDETEVRRLANEVEVKPPRAADVGAAAGSASATRKPDGTAS